MKRWLTTKRLFQIHGWLGLNLGLLLFLICFSGTVAVFSHDLDWLVEPALQVTPPEDAAAAKLSWGKLHAAVAAAHPEASIWLLVEAEDERSAARAMIEYSPSDSRWVFVNPYTAEVQGQSTLFNLGSFFRIFHKQFYILRSDYWPHGRVFVCVFSIVLLFSAVTGLLFYKKWWWALATLRFTHGRRVLFSDMHRMMGVWALLFSVMFSVTGLWYLTDQLLGDFGVEHRAPYPALESMDERGRLLDPLPLDMCVAAAQQAYPALQVRAIYPARDPGDAHVIEGDAEAVLVDTDANQVFVDPYTAEVIQVRRGHELSLPRRWVHTADPLHFGRFGGLTTKIIWTAAGAAITVGTLTGAIMWWLRVSRSKRGFFKKNVASTLVMSSITVGVIVLAIFSTLTFVGNQLRGSATTRQPQRIGEAEIGPWSIAARHHGPPVDGVLNVSIRFTGEAHPNFRAASIWCGTAEDDDAARSPRRRVDHLQARVQLPDGGAPKSLWLALDCWDGSREIASISLPASFDAAAHSDFPPPPQVPQGVMVIVAGFVACATLISLGWLALIR